ncbi:D-alanine--D-alanyl carrier protein ligase [Balamuthia mandrillaris]
MSSASKGLPQHLSCVWVGQRFRGSAGQEEEASEPLLWSLTFMPDTKRYPSAYGAACSSASISSSSSSTSSDTNSTVSAAARPSILQGTWDRNAATLKLKETLFSQEHDGGNCIITREYNGSLRIENGVLCIVGQWSYKEEGTTSQTRAGGRLLCVREEDDARVHTSGLWVGQSVPDPSLAEFYIPTNPIRWSLCLLNESAHAFGCGYFDDSADVPNRPLLFFTVHGSWDADKKRIHLVKLYEELEQTAGYDVIYEGLLDVMKKKVSMKEGEEKDKEVEAEGAEVEEELWLRGEWKNAKAMTFGQFSCRCSSLSHSSATAAALTSATLCLCDVCQQVIRPGDIRWNCATCLMSWNCCSGCVVTSGNKQQTVHLPHHELVPETVYLQETARGACSSEVALDAFRRFERRPFLAFRPPSSSPSQQKHSKNEASDGGFTWLTYGEVGHHCANVFFALRNQNFFAEQQQQKGSVALLCADLSPAYTVAMVGALMAGCILVPVHGGLDKETLRHILEKTQPTVCFVGSNYLEKVAGVLGNLSNDSHSSTIGTGTPLVVEITTKELPPLIRSNDDSNNEECDQKSLLSLDEFLFVGQEAYIQLSQRNSSSSRPPLPSASSPPISLITVQRRSLEDVSSILFTSGSTGIPKGAIFTEELMMPSEGVANIQPFIRLDFQSYDPSFALSLLQTMMCGGQRIFANNLQTLLDDFRLGRPTHVGATPTFWNSLYQDYLTRVSKGCITAQQQQGDVIQPEERERIRMEVTEKVAEEMRRMLGNRLVVATSGGAPITPQVLDFVKDKLRIDIVDLYGSRETGGITRDGIIYPGVDVRLMSVPEMGYFADGHPPQGEICVHSPRCIPGYWNDDELNAKAFVLINGKKYYRTGDIGQLQTTTTGASSSVVERRLKVIDRCGMFIKLAQGEWISPTHIETILEQCPWIEQALVLGSSSQPCTVAVIVPSSHLLSEFFHVSEKMGLKEEEEDANDNKWAKIVLDKIRMWGVHHHLRPIEIPQAVHLERATWTAENGMLTATEKKRRQVLQARYRSARDALYKQLQETLSASPSDVLSESFLDLLREVMPLMGTSVSPQATFAEIGGDSLTAARFCNRLRETHGITIQLSTLFDYPLAHISRLVSSSTAPAASSDDKDMTNMIQQQLLVASSSTSSNNDSRQRRRQHIIDWAKEWSLPNDLPSLNLRKKTHSRPVVLVTGCTGFLGPFLVQHLLRQHPADAHFYLLVRASSDATALQRLIQEYANDFEEIATLLSSASCRSRVTVLCGDVSKECLGLDKHIYQRLIDGEKEGDCGVTEVLHSGAWVNMALPYSALKASNVSGTLHVIRFALLAGARVHYVSTAGALSSTAALSQDAEDWMLLDPSQIEAKEDGYSQSKAIAEMLLYKAHQHLGLDVRVHRPGPISGDTISGVTNPHDFVSLLLRACVLLGCAVMDTTVVLHWTPVDVVAKAIVSLMTINNEVKDEDQRVFHYMNQGPALSMVMAELVKAGFSLRNVSSEEWRERAKKELTMERDERLWPLKEQLCGFEWKPKSGASGCLPTVRTKETLRSLGKDGGGWKEEDWVEVDAAIARRYIAYLAKIQCHLWKELKKS